MMKKLLFLCSAVVALGFASKAQPVPVNDTLRYFLAKQLYKLPTSTVHPVYYSNAAVTTNTEITHVGSIFKNTGTVVVTGLEGRILRPPLSVSQNGVPFTIYLANVVNGLPVFPLVDSVQVAAFSTTSLQFGQYVGGNLSTARTMTADFAILGRCTSVIDGDSVKILRTAAHTSTATNAPSPAHRFGEGLGVVRNAGVFYKTTNYNHPAFGPGTDYEFCLAPIVDFTVEATQIESPIQSGACCWEVFTNTNTSTPMLKSHQFNFNEFCRVWQPFSSNMPAGYTSDSVFTWDVGDGSPLYRSAHGVDVVQLSFVMGACNQFYNGTFTALHRKFASLSAPSFSTGLTFTSSTVYCGNDTAGTSLQEMGALANIKIFPNPTTDKTTITGLKGKNTIMLYNMTGQLVAIQVTDKDTYIIDLLKQPRGNYFIRVSDAENKQRVIKVLKE